MAGIAGWVDFSGANRERSVLTDMIAAVSHRGSDRRFWHGASAALGYCGRGRVDGEARFADTPHERVLVYDGRLFNADEWGGGGGRSEASVVLDAYQRWGSGFARRLNGVFACALWDGPRDRLLLVRDRLGVKPLYYSVVPGGVLFGSEPTAILAHPDADPVVDLDGFRELIAPARQPGAAIWRGMAEVSPGSVVVVERDGIRTERYWSLTARPVSGDPRDAAAELADLLDDAVRQQLGSGEPPVCALSGGLDSSALAALAARTLRERSQRLRTFTVDFPGHLDGFVPDSARPDPDPPFAQQVADHIEAEHQDVVIDVTDLTDPDVQRLIWSASDRLPAQCDLTAVLYHFYRAIGEKHPRVLSGEGADELLGAGRIPDAEAQEPAGVFPWLARTQGFPRFTVLSSDLERRLDLETHIDGMYRAALTLCDYDPGDSPHDRRMRESIYLLTLHDMARTLERADRLAMLTGVEVCHPFMDYRVIELTFNAGYHANTVDGREKSLLRQAVKGLLPPAVAERRKSNLPTPQDLRYDAIVEARYRGLLSRTHSPVFELADRRKLNWLAKNLGGRTSALYLRRQREDVLALDHWLTTYQHALKL